MKSFQTAKLGNNITLIHRHNKNTPRTTINLYVDGGNRTELKYGVSDLTSRLLTKGTKNRTAEDIANELDSNAIDLSLEVKQDYAKIRTTFLNEDIHKALELLADIVINPTFDQYEKEIKLYSGELTVELDSPKTRASDNLIKTMYPNHPYGVVSSVILENINNISYHCVQEHFQNNFASNNITFVSVGDFSTDELTGLINNNFGSIQAKQPNNKEINLPELTSDKVITYPKEDSAQAQILVGWYSAPLTSPDFAPLTLLNNILGSAGLSSRLFLELRDKKGLAYSVRSTYETFKHGSNFTIYIGTEPKNIKIALDGIFEEIQKIIDHPVSDEELKSAKMNVLGKRSIYHETNSQQCHYLGLYHILGAGAEFDHQITELLKNTTKEDIQAVAQRYLSKNKIISVLAPSNYLKMANRG